jgi:PRTRC genetic system protein F
MNSMTRLPALDEGIPRVLTPAAARRRGAVLAGTLIAAGLITEQTLPTKLEADHAKNCQRALQAWLNQSLGVMQCLRPLFRLTVGLSEDRGAALHARIDWYGNGGAYAVGAALERMEALEPRLGSTVLNVIDDMAWKTLPIFTPAMTHQAACDVYWCGEDNEEEALCQSCGDDEAQRAEMRANMVTRQMFDATFPEWAIRWAQGRRPLSRRALKRFAQAVRDRRVRAVIDDVLALMAIDPPRIDWSAREGDFIGFAAVLTWGDEDKVSLRVVDDFQQMLGESGDYFEECDTRVIAADDAQGFAAWAATMQPWFAAVRRLDGLIAKLSQGHWGGKSKGLT